MGGDGRRRIFLAGLLILYAAIVMIGASVKETGWIESAVQAVPIFVIFVLVAAMAALVLVYVISFLFSVLGLVGMLVILSIKGRDAALTWNDRFETIERKIGVAITAFIFGPEEPKDEHRYE